MRQVPLLALNEAKLEGAQIVQGWLRRVYAAFLPLVRSEWMVVNFDRCAMVSPTSKRQSIHLSCREVTCFHTL